MEIKVQMVVQLLAEVILKEMVVQQLNRHNQVIVVLTDLEILAVTDFIQVLQQVLKVEEAEVPAVQAVTLVLILVQMVE